MYNWFVLFFRVACNGDEMHNLLLSCVILNSLVLAAEVDGLRILSRREWGAAPPRGRVLKIRKPVPYFIIHHTEQPTSCFGESCKKSIRAIQKYHFGRGKCKDPAVYLSSIIISML